MSRYASDTSVSIERSEMEIKQALRRYGATAIGSGWQEHESTLVFEIDGRQVRMILPMPNRDDRQFTQTETGRERSESAADAAYDQACRQRWRALLLVVKAKLEAVEAGISTIEREFLADLGLPNGTTVGEHFAPQIKAIYANGQMPALLPGAPK